MKQHKNNTRVGAALKTIILVTITKGILLIKGTIATFPIGIQVIMTLIKVISKTVDSMEKRPLTL